MRRIWRVAVLAGLLAAPGARASYDSGLSLYAGGNDPRALPQLQLLADAGRVEAEVSLGSIYLHGQPGLAPDYAEAADWFQKAASQGDAIAQYTLGIMYHKGGGVEQDEAHAVELLRAAAGQGFGPALNDLGLLYAQGTGLPVGDAALPWLQQAAAGGNAPAQYALGARYYDGSGGVKQDYAQAELWFNRAASQGLAAAQINLGLLYRDGRLGKAQPERAIGLFLQAAAQGMVLAEASLGDSFYNGQGVNKDYRQAFGWYRQAAESGFAGAQNNVGWMYYKGLGVERDFQRALAWYQRAATQQEPETMVNIGLMYDRGEGVPLNHEQAQAWYRKGAELFLRPAQQGDDYAASELGMLFLCPDHGMTDEQQGIAWLSKVAKHPVLDATTVEKIKAHCAIFFSSDDGPFDNLDGPVAERR